MVARPAGAVEVNNSEYVTVRRPLRRSSKVLGSENCTVPSPADWAESSDPSTRPMRTPSPGMPSRWTVNTGWMLVTALLLLLVNVTLIESPMREPAVELLETPLRLVSMVSSANAGDASASVVSTAPARMAETRARRRFTVMVGMTTSGGSGTRATVRTLGASRQHNRWVHRLP
jgi:hypothetical protein